MQVKRFVADDMRSAMRSVREEIGADAVILSNRVVDGKVEILAARDYDEGLINEALDQSLIKSKPDSAAAHYERAAAQREQAGRDVQQTLPVEGRVPEGMTQSDPGYQAHQAAGLSQHQPDMQGDMRDRAVPLDASVMQMRDELKSLRAMIENQQVLGEWGELASRYPIRVSLYKRLTEMGLSQEMCKYLAKGLDDSVDIESAMQAALKQLVHQLPVANEDILNRGGVYALLGPTGVGKTTTVAKLAARFAMQHGPRHVALISTDTYRIGAHEQLMTYGRLLGVAVHSANDSPALQQLLNRLHDKKLILIDTAGMSQRDLGLSQQFAHLSHSASMIKPYLVLAANAQLSTLNEVIVAFKKARVEGCILSKLDESASLGGALSAIVKHNLAVAYVSNGQKVPEDLLPARARDLVNLAILHAKRHKLPVDDEFMSVAFAQGMNHAPL
ncbi:Flagellar biosynthesis protein FlhF [hydrothermal vent metagenome]|uniref:Flagellar biosynthesis protein FlhF n=1 Tax=hydrothermal vent metagenome TaxID=652676 RepID=A0A3B0XWJ8_9ZZZZ